MPALSEPGTRPGVGDARVKVISVQGAGSTREGRGGRFFGFLFLRVKKFCRVWGNFLCFLVRREAVWRPALVPTHHPSGPHRLGDGGRVAVRVRPGPRDWPTRNRLHPAVRQLRGVVRAGPGLRER